MSNTCPNCGQATDPSKHMDFRPRKLCRSCAFGPGVSNR